MNCNDVGNVEISENFKKTRSMFFVLNCSNSLNLSPSTSPNSLENLS